MVKNVKIEIPKELEKRYKSGELTLNGLLKDSENNQVIKHLPLVDDNKEEKSFDIINDVALALEVVHLGILATSFLVGYLEKKLKNKKEKEAKRRKLKELTPYNISLANYLDKAEKGELSLSDVESLQASFNAYKVNTEGNKLCIELSLDELSFLVKMIVNFTVELSKENNYEIYFDKNIVNEEIDVNTKMDILNNCFNIQKDIYSKNIN